MKKLRAHFAHQAVCTNAHYRELFSVTRYTAARELKRLVEEGYLVMAGERRGAHYKSGSGLRAGSK